MRLGSVLKYVPTDLQYGSTYRDWRRRIDQARTDLGGMAAYRNRARVEIVASVWDKAPYYRETLRQVFGSGFDPASVVDDAVWQAIPVLEGPTVHVDAPRMCVAPAARLDLTSTGGSSGQPVKFFIDRHRSPIEIAFLHDAWSVAGYRTGDARAVFRGFEIDETGERSFVFDPGLNELRCSVFRLTDPVMQGFHDEILARGIRLLQGYPSAMAIFASFLLRSG
jgi:phenylacetate-CoA ligase